MELTVRVAQRKLGARGLCSWHAGTIVGAGTRPHSYTGHGTRQTPSRQSFYKHCSWFIARTCGGFRPLRIFVPCVHNVWLARTLRSLNAAHHCISARQSIQTQRIQGFEAAGVRRPKACAVSGGQARNLGSAVALCHLHPSCRVIILNISFKTILTVLRGNCNKHSECTPAQCWRGRPSVAHVERCQRGSRSRAVSTQQQHVRVSPGRISWYWRLKLVDVRRGRAVLPPEEEQAARRQRDNGCRRYRKQVMNTIDDRVYSARRGTLAVALMLVHHVRVTHERSSAQWVDGTPRAPEQLKDMLQSNHSDLCFVVSMTKVRRSARAALCAPV